MMVAGALEEQINDDERSRDTVSVAATATTMPIR